MIDTKMIADIKKNTPFDIIFEIGMPEMSCAFVVKTDSGTEV